MSELGPHMKTTKQSEREARQLLRFCLVGGTVDEDRARLVVDSVLQSKRRGYLLLVKRFMRLLAHEYARHTAEIESALPLPTDLRISVQTGLTAVYGSGLTWAFIQRPSLIGGMRIKVGSDVYDGSVQSGLAALAKSFGIPTTNGGHAEQQ
jgi:F-type H+-transporting ATPase subunit delta